MATQLSLQENRVILTDLVRQWDRRLRLQQSVFWLPRALMPGLALGIALAVISRLRVFLLPEQILVATAAALALGLVVGGLVIWLRPRPIIASARRFDVLLDLDERISTALELLEGRIRANEELVALQVEDARLQARSAQVSQRVPIHTAPRDWLIVLVLAVVLALLLLLPNPQSELIEQDVAQTAAIEEAAEELRQITEDIAADSSLSDPERQQLLEVLERSTETLQQQNITPEEAFAAVSDVQSALRNQADLFNQRVNNSQNAFASASEQLRDFTPDDQREQPSAEQLAAALQNMAENMQSQSQEQREQAAQQLSQAAQSMENANPQAAQSMQQAAEAMQNGDQQAAQEQLQQAQESVQQQAQQTAQQQQAAEQMSQQAQTVQQAAQQVSQAAQQQSAQQSQQQSQQGQQGQQNQQGDPSQGQQGQQQGDSQAQQPGDQGQQGQQGEQAGAQQNQEQSNNAMSGAAVSSGSGDGAGDQSQNAQQGLPDQNADQNNNPDGEGERDYEPIFAPRRLGETEQTGEDIILEPDGENAPIIEDNFTENPTGSSTVPYSQVFSSYRNAANQALDSGYVPLGLRDIVRDYFTSLEPGS